MTTMKDNSGTACSSEPVEKNYAYCLIDQRTLMKYGLEETNDLADRLKQHPNYIPKLLTMTTKKVLG